MFTQLFTNDVTSKVYGERRLGGGRRLARLPLEDVRDLTDQEHASLLVAKPLVESQNAMRFVDFFEHCRAIWMFRHYADVAYSSQRRFSRETAMRNLRALVDEDAERTFATENASAHTQAVVRDFYADDMTGDDAQILYWYVRNILYYDQGLDTHERVRACRYEDVVSRPAEVMRSVYAFIDREFPGEKLTAGVHQRSVDRDIQLDATPELIGICDALHERLVQSARSTWS